MCIYELQIAIDAGKKIFPLYYRACAEFKSAFKEDGEEAEINRQLNIAALAVTELQMMDFRELRNEKLDSKKVENFLDGMGKAVCR
ncbi:hypothetical protein OO006_01655 [Prosthecochloris sp. SCSIO W1101]|uniref:hypothetical protein n=1 Tax=Prosthecochloris sp. SCSIO W1101 TaxID=2992242 RepID=UPI00223DFCE7|nr:hypothetical protein [Prosthecochloris sp. SCSIO W1101]UZJ41735.1 hypothetical protein OO006_01655 [Prosthecochloris sp. SCSIO W1101]